MKTKNNYWTMILAVVVMSAGIMACGKKDSGSSSSNTDGISTDGQTVTFSSSGQTNMSLGGSPLTVQIRNIQPQGYQIRFDMTVNSLSNVYFASNQFTPYQQLGNIHVTQAGACTDSSCNTVYVTAIFAAQSSGQYCQNQYMCQQAYEYRQIAIKRVNGSVSAQNVKVWNVGTNAQALLSLQYVMQAF